MDGCVDVWMYVCVFLVFNVANIYIMYNIYIYIYIYHSLCVLPLPATGTCASVICLLLCTGA